MGVDTNTGSSQVHHLGRITTEGEMLKFLVVCCVAALGVAGVLGLPMDMEAAATTTRPEATTEDTSGRLLSLPDPEKCANRPKHFEHGGHYYWFSGDEENLLITRLTGWTAGTSAGS